MAHQKINVHLNNNKLFMVVCLKKKESVMKIRCLLTCCLIYFMMIANVYSDTKICLVNETKQSFIDSRDGTDETDGWGDLLSFHKSIATHTYNLGWYRDGGSRIDSIQRVKKFAQSIGGWNISGQSWSGPIQVHWSQFRADAATANFAYSFYASDGIPIEDKKCANSSDNTESSDHGPTCESPN